MNFLSDQVFLQEINHFKIKEYLVSIMVLDFESEKPLAKLEGFVISGSLSISGNSITRRTGNFSLAFDRSIYNITSIKNLIAIDKKISFSLGIKNQLMNHPVYSQYGEELWFKMGVFYITGASISVSNNSITVSVNFIDKGGGLNGVCGGVLPASVSFHEQTVINEKNEEKIEYPTINRIIYEAVQHFGKEHPSRILIEDVPEVGRLLAVYEGDVPIQFENIDLEDYNSPKGRNYIIGSPPVDGYDEVHYTGEIVGYLETDLTYPGDLIGGINSNIGNILDTIAKTLGNYEFFYDTEGNFHFRKMKNFLATENTPLNVSPEYDGYLQAAYFPRYTEYQYLNELSDSSLVLSASLTPKYDNIKNDFICWGSKQSKGDTNSTRMVRYHLAIDERPEDGVDALCHLDIWKIKDIETNQVKYYTTDIVGMDPTTEVAEIECHSLDFLFADLGSNYWFNWREELYRMALINYGSSSVGSYYDEELLAEWRDIFNPENKDFQTEWEKHFSKESDPWYGYCSEVRVSPEKIRYWLDLISTNSSIGKYSVNRIGRRTIAKDDNQIDTVFQPELPDLVLIENTNDYTSMIEKSKYYVSIGQQYSFVNKDDMVNFSQKNSLGTCYDVVRQMLYDNLTYNSTASISCIPILYLDVNRVIRVNIPEYGIVGDFTIGTINFNFSTSSNTMSLSLSEANVLV